MSLPDGFILRRATTADIDTLVAHRRLMFQDMGYDDQSAMDSMAAKLRPWLLERMESGTYHAWLVCAPDGSIAAGTGLWLMDWIPHMVGKGVRRGNILNVYTRPDYRRRGLARELIKAALDWCRENHVDTIILHASPAGRALYEELGFAATNEMRIRL